MTASATQIVTLFETQGLSVEQIADALELDVVAVKAALMQFSSKYRGGAREEKQLDFTDDELELANKTLVNVLRSTEDENLKVRCAKYIRQDKKGRLDKTMFGRLNINVNTFNIEMQKARAAIQAGRDKIIEIPAEIQKILVAG